MWLMRQSFRQGTSRILFSALSFQSSRLVDVAASRVRMSCCLHCSVSSSRSRCNGYGQPLKRSLVWSRSTAAVSFSLPTRCKFFPLLSLASSYSLLPHFGHQKEISAASTKETTLIGRISDIVLSGCGSYLVT
jgi:hypothetical protein